jgi:hypothetical protein
METEKGIAPNIRQRNEPLTVSKQMIIFVTTWKQENITHNNETKEYVD